MYLRHTTRVKDGKAHTYWRLVRSVRVGRKVVQQTVAQLGELDAEGRAQARALARTITGGREQPELFASIPADAPRERRLAVAWNWAAGRLEGGAKQDDAWKALGASYLIASRATAVEVPPQTSRRAAHIQGDGRVVTCSAYAAR
jgi:hypothetical protein